MATNDKTKMKFKVVAMRDPSDPTKSVFVPAICDRNDPLPLSRVIAAAINEGRIAGLKTNAAKSVAEGICDQIYEKLKDGDAVEFGRYFHVKLFLDGTVQDAGAGLTEQNKVNIRLMPGPDFKIGRDAFSWSNVANDKAATIEYIIGANDVRDEILRGGAISVEGSGFGNTAEGVTVTFTFEGGEAVAGAVSHVGPNRVEVAWPSALADVPAGTEISCTVVKTVDGVDYPSNAKSATLVSAE